MKTLSSQSQTSRRPLLLKLALAPFVKFSKLADDLFESLFPRPAAPLTTVTVWQPTACDAPEPVSLDDCFLIGNAVNTKEPVYAMDPQLDRHCLIIGGTGCGKTTLIARYFTEEVTKWQ